MKKLIFLLPLIFTLSASSQPEKPITKGNMIISGGIGVDYSKIKSTTPGTYSTMSTFELSLNPGISYFFIDNLAIGLITDFGYNSYSNNNSEYYSIGIGPTVKYYFENGILIKGETTYDWLRGLGDNPGRFNTLTFKPGVGYAFFINSKVSLEPSLNYRFMSYKAKNDGYDYVAKTNSLLLELNIVIFL